MPPALLPPKPQARAWTLSDLMLDGIGSFIRNHEPQFSPTLPPVSAGTRRRKPLCGPGPAANPVDDESWIPVDRLHLPVRVAPLEMNTSPPSSSGGASSRRQSSRSARHRSGGGSSSRSTARSSMRSARTPRPADATGSEPATVDKDGGASNSSPFLRSARGSPFTVEKDSARGSPFTVEKDSARGRLASMGEDARAVAGATDAASSRRSTPRSSRRSIPRRTGQPPVRSAALGAAALGSVALGSVALGSPTSSHERRYERRDERRDVDGKASIDMLHPSDTLHPSEEGDRSRISTSMQVPITTRLASNANADLNADLSNEARSARRRDADLSNEARSARRRDADLSNEARSARRLNADLSNEARSARRRLSASAAAVCRWDAAVPLSAC